MRILHVVTGLNTGGAERTLVKLLTNFGGDFESSAVSLTTRGSVAAEIEMLGVPVHALGMQPKVSAVFAMLRLVALMKNLKPHIVQTWMYHADLLGALAARRAGVSAVVWNIRNNDLSPDKTKWTTRATAKLCALTSTILPKAIICCSASARAVHQQLGYDVNRVTLIHNGFDLDLFRPDKQHRADVRRELAIPTGAPLVGLVARFDPQKDHRSFFFASGLLHRSYPAVHFVLAGKGVDQNNSEIGRLVTEAGVGDVTRLLGERHDIPRLTAALDIASSSSWGESFPNVIGEAMACGVPCVVTNVGDSAFIVGDTGRVVPRGDARALAGAWEDLLSMSDTEREMLGASARARIAEKFNVREIVKRYERLYESLVRI